MDKILVTGGCGYIGSHTIIDLVTNGFEVICVDNNSNSSAKMLLAVEQITGVDVPHYQVDLCDLDATKAVFEAHTDLVGVIHFAAYKSVPESTEQPLKYYQNNINSLLNILECMKAYQVPNLIFSSSCSVYGNSTELPVKETTPMQWAQSPYAYTKQVAERIVQDFVKAVPSINAILLRYFNPGGAHPSGQIGEIPQQGSYNVIPIIIEAAVGIRPQFSVTGDDHDTRDGSCVRDYIHVMDVGNAHTKALQYIAKKDTTGACEVFNIGIGDGVSVLELIQAFEQATGQQLNYAIGPRRAGDVSAVYADATKAKELLGWSPQYSVYDILSTAWKWYETGYKLPE